MELIRLQDKEKVLSEARETLVSFLEEHKEQPVLFLASGGSALEILSDLDSTHLGENVTIGVLDERYDQSPDINNFAQLTKTNFYKQAREKGAVFIDTQLKADESLAELAARFENSIKSWRSNNPDGKVIITQGIGEDGHTAGIMPYPEDPELFKTLFDQPGRWVVGYDVALTKNPYPLRATVTLSFLREEVDQLIVYVQGEKKRAALSCVLATAGSLAETPARIIHEMKSVAIFTDIVG